MTEARSRRIDLVAGEAPHEYDELIDSLATFLVALDAERRRDLASRGAGAQIVREALAIFDPVDQGPAVRPKRRGRTISEETRAKMAAAQRARQKRAREQRGGS